MTYQGHLHSPGHALNRVSGTLRGRPGFSVARLAVKAVGQSPEIGSQIGPAAPRGVTPVDRHQQGVDGTGRRGNQTADSPVRLEPGFKIGQAADPLIHPVVLVPGVDQAGMRHGGFHQATVPSLPQVCQRCLYPAQRPPVLARELPQRLQ